VPRNGWHPLAERLSYRDQTLDEDLMHLGISPHPRVVLAIEGGTEQTHVPLIWKQLDYPDAPELLRLLMLDGDDRDLEKGRRPRRRAPDRPEGPEPEPGPGC
jgi:hypothetical protein